MRPCRCFPVSVRRWTSRESSAVWSRTREVCACHASLDATGARVISVREREGDVMGEITDEQIQTIMGLMDSDSPAEPWTVDYARYALVVFGWDASDAARLVSWAEAGNAVQAVGREHGHNAGTWFFDGNTTEATWRFFRGGLDVGDPMVMDRLPGASWAAFTGSDELEYPRDARERMWDVYAQAFADAAQAEVQRAVSAHFADE